MTDPYLGSGLKYVKYKHITLNKYILLSKCQFFIRFEVSEVEGDKYVKLFEDSGIGSQDKYERDIVLTESDFRKDPCR